MKIARYWVNSSSPLFTPRFLFVAWPEWKQVLIRGVDAGGIELPWPLLQVQRGGGILEWKESCGYEIVFVDEPRPLDDAALNAIQVELDRYPQRTLRGDGLACSPRDPLVAKFDEDPPPPPPPNGYPKEPFVLGNVFRINV